MNDKRSSYKRIKEQVTAELELKQETEHGITDKEAVKLITKFWQTVTKHQNERARRFLALAFIKMIEKSYPGLTDEAVKNFD